MKGLSLLTLGLKMDQSTPSASSYHTILEAHMALPLSAWRINGRGFPFGHIPGHHFAAPDLDHHIEVKPNATHAGGHVGAGPLQTSAEIGFDSRAVTTH